MSHSEAPRLARASTESVRTASPPSATRLSPCTWFSFDASARRPAPKMQTASRVQHDDEGDAFARRLLCGSPR